MPRDLAAPAPARALEDSPDTAETHQALLKVQEKIRNVHSERRLNLAARRELEEQGKRILGKNEQLSKALDAAAEAHSRAWCLDIASRIQVSFPPEIRNIIYEYLCTDLAVFSVRNRSELRCPDGVGSWFDTQGTHQVVDNGPFEQRLRTQIPHYLSLSFVGRPMCQEISGIFYQNVHFKLDSIEDIQNFLEIDILHAGCIPRDHVRYLSVSIKNSKCQNHWDGPVLDKFCCNSKVRHLPQLLSVKHTNAFELVIDLGLERCFKYLLKYEESLVPVVYLLKENDFDVNVPAVSFHGGWSPREFHFDFERPIEHWLETISTNSAFDE